MKRTKNVFLNLIWAIIAQAIILVLGFLMPRFVIIIYGSSINGLTATINQVLNVLNLLQAGALGASIFALFKPIADANFEQISIILHSSKKYFNRLGLIFLLLVIIVTPFIALYKEGNGVSSIEIILALLILGVNASFSFFFISRFDIMFSADRKRYILSISSIVEKLIYYGLLFLILSYRVHFIYMYLSVLVGSCIKLIFLSHIFKKKYSHLIVLAKKNEYIKIPNRNYLLLNQISTQVIESSPVILIAYCYDFKEVSVYSIYYLVMLMIKTIISTFQISVSEVFGNMVVSEGDDKIKTVFNLMQFAYIVIGMFISIIAAFLFMPFISLYTSGMTDTNYYVPNLALFIIIYSLAICLYMPYYTLSNVYGFYKETYLQSALTAIIGIFISIINTKFFTMPFVLIGLIFYYLFSTFYRIIIIKQKIKWVSLKEIQSSLILFISLPILAYYLQQKYFTSVSSWENLIILSIITTISTVIILSVYFALFERTRIKPLKDYIKQLIDIKRIFKND